jgi:hypothetical protein
MVYEVITFKKDVSDGLLRDQYDSSSSSKAKKMNLFSKFGKKKKEDDDEYLPPTAPSSPADETPLNVTVIPNDASPPAPYLMNKAVTEISDITMLATAHHRVGFDPSTKEQTHRKTGTASSLPSLLETATLESEIVSGNQEVSLSATPSDSEGSVWNMIEEICQVPTLGKNKLENNRPAAASPPITNLRRPAWGSVPSVDDDDTFMGNSYQSTNENSASTGFQTSREDTTTKASTLAEILKKKTVHTAFGPTTHEPPTHENFEVVLDPTVLTLSESSNAKRRGWFGQKDEEEERKSVESDTNEYATHMADMEALKDEEPKDAAASPSPVKPSAEKSSSEKPSLIKRLSNVKFGKFKDLRGEKSEKKKRIDKSSQSPEGTRFLDQPTRTNNPWNNKSNNPNQLQLAKEKRSARKKKAQEKNKPAQEKNKPKSGQEERGRMGQSLGPFIAAALRKRSKKDSELKSPPSSPKSLPTSPKSLPRTPEKPARQKRLKPLWKAVKDPGSGKTYYYHRKTRETTWKKPKELDDWENAYKAPANVEEKEMEVTLEEVKNRDLAPDAPKKASENSWPGISAAYVDVALTKTTSTSVAVVPASPARLRSSPASFPAVISAAISGDSQDGDEQFDIGLNKPSRISDGWEKKREINRLLTDLAPSDKASVNKIMRDSAGNEDELLRQLRDLVESQPFDEPFLDELDGPPSPLRSAYSINGRVRTHASRASAATKSSAMTGKTQKIKNTSDGRLSNSTVAPISESKSTASSISSNHDDNNHDDGLPPPGSHLTKPIANNARIPSKVPAVPRKRELIIEEFTGSKAETFGVGGRVVRGGITDEGAGESYYGDSEVDTYGTDSVSALSENDPDLLSRKNNFDQARRRALDDAVEREDWELAAVLTEGLRQSGGSPDVVDAHSSWNQSSLDKFIADNDWSAVSGYIAQMLIVKKKEPTPPAREEPVIPKPSEPPAAVAAASIKRTPPPAADSADPSLKKKIGSRSQLQHRDLPKSQARPKSQVQPIPPKELLSESSWTTDSSYDSYDSDYS